tara:strand:+ start:6287 stop:6880 length:594 start_codon:yes stop_codon:yes gene_type:complete
MSYRKEKKFRLSQYDMSKVMSSLRNLGMKNLHPKRTINSQYFDNLSTDMFIDSEEGLLPRKKVRVRWYDDKSNLLNLEEKTSSIEGRFKESKRIDKQAFEDMKKNGILHNLYGRLFPSVLVQYQREYFIYENVRITFDTNIKYKHHDLSVWFRDFERVVEIKVPVDTSDDFLEKIFPVPTSRFSKYARAFLLKNRNL